jgi:uncharacterized protein with FMN-binding domain
VRKSTAFAATLVAASSLVISLRIGDLVTQDDIEPRSSASIPGTVDVTTPSPTATSSEQALPTPSQTESAGPPEPKPKPKPISKNSDVIEYKYGVLQISMTLLSKKITEVSVIQGDLTNGRKEAYEILTDATIQVQGTDYGNVSGATYTTEAFKLAVNSALGKF